MSSLQNSYCPVVCIGLSSIFIPMDSMCGSSVGSGTGIKVMLSCIKKATPPPESLSLSFLMKVYCGKLLTLLSLLSLVSCSAQTLMLLSTSHFDSSTALFLRPLQLN